MSACELGVFSALSEEPLSLSVLAVRLRLHRRGAGAFLDTLVAMGLLLREGGLYANTPEAEFYLVEGKEPYMGALLQLVKRRLMPAWASLSAALQTGECHHHGDLFGTIVEAQGRSFFRAMTNVSCEGNQYIAERLAVPWERYGVVIDVGTAEGDLVAAIARRHPQLLVRGLDLPPVRPWFEENLRSKGLLSERVGFVEGDFWRDPLPAADVLTLGHVLHDWGLEERRVILRKAFAALSQGGVVVVYESFVDEQRPDQIWPQISSLNMLVNTPGGSEMSVRLCTDMLNEAGFESARVEHVNERESVIFAFKPAEPRESAAKGE